VRTKVTLVLVFLNVALFFFIFKFERNWRTEAASLEARRRVLGPEAADIRTLEVGSPVAGASFSLAKRGETWWLTKPLEWPANPHAVDSLIKELNLLEHESSFGTKDLAKNGQSLADYGLDKPKLTIAFTSGEASAAASTPVTLQIGDATKSGNRLYILSSDGSRIHVVSHALADTFSLTLDQLREDTLFTIPVFVARSLSVRTGNPDQARGAVVAGVPVRVRRDGSHWTFDTPFSGRGGKTAIDIAISGLDALHAKTFNPPNPPATPPSAAPTMRITLEGTNGSETLFLGEALGSTAITTGAATAPDVEYYAQLEGSEQGGKTRAAIFTVAVPALLLDTLRNAKDQLRERHVLDFTARAVTAVTLAAPVQPDQPSLTLQLLDPTARADDNAPWQLVRRGDGTQGPQILPADRAAVQRLLQQLTLLSAKNPGGFVSDAPADTDLENWGFKRPERELTLTLAEPGPARGGAAPAAAKTTTLVLQLGTDSAHRLYARVDPAQNSKTSVYAVDFDVDRELPVTPLAWRERLVHALPAVARLTALRLAPVGDNATPLYAHTLAAGETWDAALAAEPAARQAALRTVLEQLTVLRARQFLQDTFTEKISAAGDERPWKYQLDATVSLPGGAGGEQTSTLTLFLTERLGGAEQYAGAKEFGVVFGIEQPFLDALTQLTYGPRDPGPPPAEEPKK